MLLLYSSNGAECWSCSFTSTCLNWLFGKHQALARVPIRPNLRARQGQVQYGSLPEVRESRRAPEFITIKTRTSTSQDGRFTQSKVDLEVIRQAARGGVKVIVISFQIDSLRASTLDISRSKGSHRANSTCLEALLLRYLPTLD